MNKKARILAVILSLAMLVSVFAGCSKAPMSSLGTVDGREIPWSEFTYYLNSAISSVEQNLSMTYDQIKDIKVGEQAFEQFVKNSALQSCIQNRYIEMKYDELGLVFDDAAQQKVDEMMSSLVEQYGGAIQFNESLSAIGTTKDEFKKIGIIGYKQTQIIEKLFGDGAEQEITDQDVKDYYEKEYTKVQHILISTQDAEGNAMSDELKQAQKELADSLMQQVKAGADFLELMKANTADVDKDGNPNSPEGYLFDSTANYMQEFKDLAFKLKVGEIGMTETTYGFHVMKRLDINENEADFEGIKETILTTIQDQKLEEALTDIKASAVVDTDEEALNSYVITRASK